MLGRTKAHDSTKLMLPAAPPGRISGFVYGLAVSLLAFAVCGSLFAEGGGATAAGVTGVVTDPSGAVVPGATVEIMNPVSQFRRSVVTDQDGKFSISNIPTSNYHLTVTSQGFVTYAQDVD